MSGINSYMNKLEKILRIYKNRVDDAKSVQGDFALLNMRRIFYASIAMLLLSLMLAFAFIFTDCANEMDLIWHNGIILVHCMSIVIMPSAAIISRYFIRRRKKGFPVLLLQYLLFAVTLCGGMLFTLFGLVVSSSNITGFLLACIAAGTVFIVRPKYSLIFYAVSYVIYFFAVSIPLADYNALLSVRANGLGAVVLGIVVSVINWRAAFTNTLQSRRIETQRHILLEAAYMDSLTGLQNRRSFDKLLSDEIKREQDGDMHSCLIMLDIDEFKNVNDKYGHPNGDLVLTELSKLLTRNVRKADTVCRLGGDEFTIFLSRTRLYDALKIAEKLRSIVESYVFEADGQKIQITASFGVAPLDRNEDPAFISQYSAVDKALYLAKHAGKNRVITV